MLQVSVRQRRQIKNEVVELERLEIAEFKRLGHPDRVADWLVSSVVARLLTQDPEARIDADTVVHFGPIEKGGKAEIWISGQICSVLSGQERARLVEAELKKALTGAGYSVPAKNIVVHQNFSGQSPEIAAHLENDGKEKGAGDSTISVVYASPQTKLWLGAAHALVQTIVQLLDDAFWKRTIRGLLPDGKVQAIVRFDNAGAKAERVTIAAQHDKDADVDTFKKEVRQVAWQSNELLERPNGTRLNLIGRETEIVVNGKDRFSIGGPEADDGVSCRHDAQFASGGTRIWGGGNFFGRDVSKTDVSCLLVARKIALHIGEIAHDDVEVKIAYTMGATAPDVVEVKLYPSCNIPPRSCNDLSSRMLEDIVRSSFDLSPEGIAAEVRVRPEDYKRIARNGLFGVQSTSARGWETIEPEKLRILKNCVEKNVRHAKKVWPPVWRGGTTY